MEKYFSSYGDSEDRFKWPLKYYFPKCIEDVCQTAITHTQNIVSKERTNHLHIRKIINQWVAYSDHVMCIYLWRSSIHSHS